MEIYKCTYEVDEDGNIFDGQRTKISSTAGTLEEAAREDLVSFLTERNVEDITDHLDTFVFESTTKDIVVYDGSNSVQIHYILVE